MVVSVSVCMCGLCEVSWKKLVIRIAKRNIIITAEEFID